MGAVKKVFKSVGKVFGIGSTESAPAMPSIDTTTTTMNVTNQDMSGITDSIANPNRRKKSNDLAVAGDTGDTILGGAGRTTTGV